MCIQPVSFQPAGRKLSAHDISKIALALMLVLIVGTYLLQCGDFLLAAAIVQIAAFLSLMIAGIAIMFIPEDMTWMRNLGLACGVSLTIISCIMFFLLLHLILGIN